MTFRVVKHGSAEVGGAVSDRIMVLLPNRHLQIGFLLYDDRTPERLVRVHVWRAMQISHSGGGWGS